jgi:hypothetical protein
MVRAVSVGVPFHRVIALSDPECTLKRKKERIKNKREREE